MLPDRWSCAPDLASASWREDILCEFERRSVASAETVCGVDASELLEDFLETNCLYRTHVNVKRGCV